MKCHHTFLQSEEKRRENKLTANILIELVHFNILYKQFPTIIKSFWHKTTTQPMWFHRNLIPAPNWIPSQILQSNDIRQKQHQSSAEMWLNDFKTILIRRLMVTLYFLHKVL